MSRDFFPRGRTAIVGAATFGLGEAQGFTATELAANASVAALAKAGLRPSDVDGLFGCISDDMLSSLAVADYLGIQPNLSDNTRVGGSSFLLQVNMAALALDAGQCDVALIYYGSNQRTAAGKLVSVMRNSIYESAYKPVMPIAAYALAAARHMHQFGTTREQLGAVAVAARQWAQLNPDAFMREPLTLEAYLAARMVASPLSVRDCCLVTDGAGAIVMTRADRAPDHAARPAYVLAAAAEISHREIAQMPDLTVTAARQTGKRAYAQSGYSPADIDVVQLYDAFTINTILFVEDLGFCPKGEGGRFVADGNIAPGGKLPVNTNGGGLSCTHPGMYGLFTLIEATEQIMGNAGARQRPSVELALAHGNGAVLSSQATVILGSADTL
jgi:acetyl-CoA acetyltransferase